jgi:hypothetical protein
MTNLDITIEKVREPLEQRLGVLELIRSYRHAQDPKTMVAIARVMDAAWRIWQRHEQIQFLPASGRSA